MFLPLCSVSSPNSNFRSFTSHFLRQGSAWFSLPLLPLCQRVLLHWAKWIFFFFSFLFFSFLAFLGFQLQQMSSQAKGESFVYMYGCYFKELEGVVDTVYFAVCPNIYPFFTIRENQKSQGNIL